jgi:hypothetical protein
MCATLFAGFVRNLYLHQFFVCSNILGHLKLAELVSYNSHTSTF